MVLAQTQGRTRMGNETEKRQQQAKHDASAENGERKREAAEKKAKDAAAEKKVAMKTAEESARMDAECERWKV